MADTKISALTDGNPAQAGDAIPIARSGSNFKITPASILAYGTSPVAGTTGTFTQTLAVTGVATLTAQPILSALTASSAVATDAVKGLVSVTNTGTGNNVLATSPTLVTPALGTPTALVGTNITGTAAGLTAGNVTTNANLTGAVTSVGNATSLGSFTSAQLIAALTDETGTGVAVFATSPALVTPTLGTPASGNLSSCTADGTNPVGYKNIPQVGSAKSASYTLVATDVGKFVVLTTSGLVVVPASIFAVGDIISVFNNTAAGIVNTCSAITAYLGGTNTIVTSFTLASRGVCTILFVTTSLVVITGNVT